MAQLPIHKELATALPADALSASQAVRVAYSSDNSRKVFVPDLVVWPRTEADVVKIVKAARTTKTPLYIRGRGSATTGASLAEHGGVVMSTERLAEIDKPDLATRTITVEPGVLNAEIDSVLAPHGLFWPPDPSSKAYSSIGGNLATAAAGPRGVRYGGVRENVLAVRAVTGAGEVIACGAKVPKSVVGYDLARLLVGSEGTLAVITQATLRLEPKPLVQTGLAASYPDSHSACTAIAAIQQTKLLPSAVEFLDAGCLDLVRSHCELPPAAKALLLVGIDADNNEQAEKAIATAKQALQTNATEVATASPGTGAWLVRSVLSQNLRKQATHKVNEDVAVPVGKLAELITVANQVAQQAGMLNLNFGHAAAGNLHINFLYDDELADADTKVKQAVDTVMEFVVKTKGTISGEHGIGIAKRDYVQMQLGKEQLAICKGIKHVFDPDNILNPEKIF